MTCLDHAANTGWGQDPSPLLPSPERASWSLLRGGPSPLGGSLAVPPLHSSFFWLPRLVLFVRELWMKLPPAARIHTFASYHPKASPGAHSEILTLARQLPSLLPSPVSGTVLLSLFLIPFPRMWPSGFSMKAWRKSGADVDSCPPIWTVEDQWLQVKGAGRLGGCGGSGTDGSSAGSLWAPRPWASHLDWRTQQPLGHLARSW